MSTPSLPTTALSIRLESELYKRLARIAEQYDRNISQEVRRAIEAHVRKKENFRAMGTTKKTYTAPFQRHSVPS